MILTWREVVEPLRQKAASPNLNFVAFMQSWWEYWLSVEMLGVLCHRVNKRGHLYCFRCFDKQTLSTSFGSVWIPDKIKKRSRASFSLEDIINARNYIFHLHGLRRSADQLFLSNAHFIVIFNVLLLLV